MQKNKGGGGGAPLKEICFNESAFSHVLDMWAKVQFNFNSS